MTLGTHSYVDANANKNFMSYMFAPSHDFITWWLEASGAPSHVHLLQLGLRITEVNTTLTKYSASHEIPRLEILYGGCATLNIQLLAFNSCLYMLTEKSSGKQASYIILELRVVDPLLVYLTTLLTVYYITPSGWMTACKELGGIWQSALGFL